MTRKIDEVFEFQGHKLKAVLDDKMVCEGCFFEDSNGCTKRERLAGSCILEYRDDGNDVIFIRVE